MRLDPWEDRPWRFASQEPKLLSTIALSMGLKTLYMITKDFTTSTTALFKDLLISSSVLGDPFTRSSFVSYFTDFLLGLDSITAKLRHGLDHAPKETMTLSARQF